jgi:hypothetical protein
VYGGALLCLVEALAGVGVKRMCLAGVYRDVDGSAEVGGRVIVASHNEFLFGSGIVTDEGAVDVFIGTKFLDEVDRQLKSLSV